MTAPTDRVLEVLQGVRQHGDGWQARCPAHEDRVPSLSISEGADGRVLLKCHAGCDTAAVLTALGLEAKVLFAASSPEPKATIAATYDYVDENGVQLFQVVRMTPKGFRQRRPDGYGGWTWNLKGTRRVLFHLPALLQAVRDGISIFVVEGEKDCLAVEAVGAIATTAPQGAGKWRDEYSASLAGADVVVVADRDAAGYKHALFVSRALDGVAASVRVVEAIQGSDVSDHLAAGHVLEDLVLIDPGEALGALDGTGASGGPSSQPVIPVDEDGAALLDEIAHEITRFVAMPSSHAVTAVVLWVAATHAQQAWQHATRLVLRSPQKRCAKSRLMDVIEPMSHRALITVNASPPAIFRSLDEADPPTLFVDEADTIFNRSRADGTEELRGMLNAGFQRGRPALRCVGPNLTPTAFATFAMVCLAAIGDAIPDTITDRAAVVTMRRRAPGEVVTNYRLRMRPHLIGLGDRLGAWARAHLEELAGAEPTLPVTDRAADCWEPLVAIADLAGGRWPALARAAATTFTIEAEQDAADESLEVRFLSDLKAVFDQPELASEDIVRRLREIPDAPWASFDFNQRNLARRLKPYGIKPDRVRPNGRHQVRGYRLQDLTDTFTRYMPDPTSRRVTPSQPLAAAVTDTEPVTLPPVTGSDTVTDPTSEGDAKTQGDAAAEDVDCFGRRPCAVCGKPTERVAQGGIYRHSTCEKGTL